MDKFPWTVRNLRGFVCAPAHMELSSPLLLYGNFSVPGTGEPVGIPHSLSTIDRSEWHNPRSLLLSGGDILPCRQTVCHGLRHQCNHETDPSGTQRFNAMQCNRIGRQYPNAADRHHGRRRSDGTLGWCFHQIKLCRAERFREVCARKRVGRGHCIVVVPPSGRLAGGCLHFSQPCT